jgi:hypothetical protein
MAKKPKPNASQRRFFVIEPNAKDIAGHYFNYAACVASAAEDLGLRAGCIVSAQFVEDASNPTTFDVFPILTRNYAAADQSGSKLGRGIGYGYETLQALAHVNAGPQDIAYVSTIGCAEFLEWLEMLALDGSTILEGVPLLHLMLRCDPTIAYDNLRAFQTRARKAFGNQYVCDRVMLHADTAELARCFEEILETRVSVAPIPFNQGHLAKAGPKRRSGPLNLVYLGDARLEKGFNEIAEAILDLNQDLIPQNKVRFTLQANMNTPGGETGILASKTLLSRFSASKVTLLNEPLDSKTYYETLSAADGVLIVYDPVRYRERSSGVLIEAAAAGKPVLTTAGSWMATLADQIAMKVIDNETPLCDAVRAFVAEHESLNQRALEQSAYWKQWSSPKAFVQHLLDTEAQHAALSPSSTQSQYLFVTTAETIISDGIERGLAAGIRAIVDAGDVVDLLLLEGTRSNSVPRQHSDLQQALVRLPIRSLIWAGFDYAAGPRSTSGLRGRLAVARRSLIGAEQVKQLRATQYRALVVQSVDQLELVNTLDVQADLKCLFHSGFMSHTIALDSGEEWSEEDLSLEYELMGGLDSALVASSDDGASLPLALRGVAVTLPIARRGLCLDARSLAGASFLDELLQLGAGHHVDVPDTISQDSALDVMFVGEDTPTGRASAAWFVNEVYKPYLHERKVTVGLGGSVSKYAASFFDGGARLVTLGKIEAVEPILAACKIVVDPDNSPNSMSSFALDAIESCKPIVRRSRYLMAVNGTCSYPYIAQKPEVFATMVLDLLRSEKMRRGAQEQLLPISQQFATPARIAQVWQRAVEHKGQPRALVQLAPDTDATGAAASRDLKTELVEWSPEVAASNRVLREWAKNVVPLIHDRRTTERAFANGMGPWISAIWQAGLSGQGKSLEADAGEGLRRAGMIGIAATDLVGAFDGVGTKLGLIQDANLKPVAWLMVQRDAILNVMTFNASGEPLDVPCRIQDYTVMQGQPNEHLAHTVRLSPIGKRGPLFRPVRIEFDDSAVASVTVLTEIKTTLKLGDISLSTDKDATLTSAAIQLSIDTVLAGPAGETRLLTFPNEQLVQPIGIKLLVAKQTIAGEIDRDFGARTWSFNLPPPSNIFEPTSARLDLEMGPFDPKSLIASPLDVYAATTLRFSKRSSLLAQTSKKAEVL